MNHDEEPHYECPFCGAVSSSRADLEAGYCAPTADSGKEIKPFVEECLSKARSGDFSTVEHSANQARRHGFVNSANSRYADFLADFRSSPHLTTKYASEYPNCVFLPWAAFHRVRAALDLWCDLPQFYAGGVPDAQMPWLDIFELRDADRVTTPWEDFHFHGDGVTDFHALMGWGEKQWPSAILRGHFARKGHQLLESALRQFAGSFFVLAPREAFTTSEVGKDWITRTMLLVEETVNPTDPPDDPLVIRFCRGGCLVVAAWGDEAAELNQMVRELGV